MLENGSISMKLPEDYLDGYLQGGDSSAGMQALPVGKIIETEVCRKDNPKVSQICIC